MPQLSSVECVTARSSRPWSSRQYRRLQGLALLGLLLSLGLSACQCSSPSCPDTPCEAGLLCEAGSCVPVVDPNACSSDTDCAGQAGRTHCDAAGRQCVECLFASHCADPQTQQCDTGSHRCLPRPACATDASCADLPATPHCESVSGACVRCTDSSHCSGTQMACNLNSFICDFSPCSADGNCAPYPDTPYCAVGSGLCQACTKSTQCGTDEVCKDGLCQAKGECVRNGDCVAGQVCDTTGIGTCLQCKVNLDCRLGGVCRSGWCTPKDPCTGDVDCGAPWHCQLSTGLCVACTNDAHCGSGQRCGSDGLCQNPASCSAGERCIEAQACVAGSCRDAACADDDLESNDVPYSASVISSGLLENRVLCPNTWDWYLAGAEVGDGVRVDLLYDRSQLGGGVDPTLLVWTGTGNAPALAGQASLTPAGQKVEIASLVRAGPLWIGVEGVNQGLSYALNLNVSSGGLCDDDPLEPNDSAATPTTLPAPMGGKTQQSAIACFADEDWYALSVPAGLRVVGSALPTDGSSAGNLVLSIFVQSVGGGLTLVGGSGSNLATAAAAPADRVALLRVSRVTAGSSAYDLEVRLRPPRPANDACSATAPLAEGVLVQGTTAGGTDDGTTACGGSGSADVSYQFQLASPRQVTLTTTGALDTVLAIQSSCGVVASELVCHDQAGAAEQLSAVLPAGTFTVWVDGYGAGAEGSFDLSLQTAPPPPPPLNEDCGSATLLDPLLGGGTETGDLSLALDDLQAGCSGPGGPGSTGAAGGDAVYSLTLTAPALLSLDLAGAEGLSLSLRGVCTDPLTEQTCVATDPGLGAHLDLPYLPAGSYSLIIDGGGPAAGAFSLSWALGTPIPPPGNEDCNSSEPLVISAGLAQVSGDTRNAADDLAPSCAQAAGSGGDVVYSFALLSAQAVRATLSPSFAGSLELRSLPCADAAGALACDTALNPTIFEPALAPGIYYLVVDGFAGGAGPFGLQVQTQASLTPPLGDACATPKLMDVQTGPVSDNSYTYLGFDDLNPGTLCTPFGQPGKDVVYAVPLLAGQTLQATATPEPGFDLSIYLLSSCDAQSCLAGSDASFTSGPETVSKSVAADQTIYVVVDSWSATRAGFFTLDLGLQ